MNEENTSKINDIEKEWGNANEENLGEYKNHSDVSVEIPQNNTSTKSKEPSESETETGSNTIEDREKKTRKIENDWKLLTLQKYEKLYLMVYRRIFSQNLMKKLRRRIIILMRMTSV